MASPNANTALRLRGIEKSFPGVHAVRRVDLDIREGEVHGLVGENGAGKSTLVRMMSGAITPDDGSITVLGQQMVYGDPRSVIERGTATVYQEPTLIPSLSPPANIFLGRPRTRFGFLLNGEMKRRVQQLAEELEIDIPRKGATGDLALSQQRLVDIVGAIERNARIVIMDEPTASFPLRAREMVYGLIERLKQDGVTVVFVSHDLEEVLQTCDVVTVLRDGQVVWTRNAEELGVGDLITAMLGRAVEVTEGRRGDRTTSTSDERETALEVSGLCIPPKLTGVDLTVRRGEIVGIAGLAGSGRTTLLRALAGAGPVADGRMAVRGRDVAWPLSPRQAQRLGIMLAPENRRTQGLVLQLSAAENIRLASLGRTSRHGFLTRKFLRRAAMPLAEKVQFPVPRLDAMAATFSGGNQQKLVLAKALSTQPRVLLLDEPLRGIDIGAKVEIQHLILSLANDGVGILVADEDLNFLASFADRIIVLSRRTIAAEHIGDDIDPSRVLKDMFAVEQSTQGFP